MAAKSRRAASKARGVVASRPNRIGPIVLLVGVLALGGLAVWWLQRRPAESPAAPAFASAPANNVLADAVPDQHEAYAEYAGSPSCRECHEEAFAAWEKSNHGLAERPLNPELDQPAFDPSRTFRHGTQTTSVRFRDGQYEVEAVGLSGRPEVFRVERVIGNDPLRQFLVPFPGGRLQTLEASYDPHRNEWFNVYGEEDRQPGEWGHWTGRGMNWNNMCAGCHNVRVRKNYDAATDSYHTAMVEHGVGCESCHGPLKRHGEWRKLYPDKTLKDPTLTVFSTNQVVATCAGCHARRGDLTGDFVVGDSFFDHYSLVIVDPSDTYYPDGQVRDEDYEYAAFLGSRMGNAGVSCLDCHDPHSMKTRLPGNWLCLRCHNGSYANAPVIEPVSHAHHKVFGYDTNGVPTEVDLMAYDPRKIAETGGECVACHMPITNYMQRHPRHDHGYTIPDPLLTQQLGIPNACNRCHTDKSVDWALEATAKWYGAKMERPSRQRAQLVARARRGDPAAREPMLAWLNTETNTYWRAVAAGMLEAWAGEPAVAQALRRRLDDPQPLVRERAVRALEPLVAADRGVAAALVARLDDPVRAVRVAAAWALRDRVDLASRAGRDLLYMLDSNADQPGGQMQNGTFAMARTNLTAALSSYQKAATWDPNSAPIRHDFAVALSLAGRPREALSQMQAACRLAPKDAEYAYKLGLAWSELGNLKEAAAALERAVQLDPRHARAWYNLGLARNSLGHPVEALEALLRAESITPDDARIPYARATILAQQGRTDEARAAARRALEIQREFGPALELLRQFP